MHVSTCSQALVEIKPCPPAPWDGDVAEIWCLFTQMSKENGSKIQHSLQWPQSSENSSLICSLKPM